MLTDPTNTPQPGITKTPVEGEGAVSPRGLKPWEDRSLAAEERKEAYAALVQEKLAVIASAFDRAGEAQDVATQKEIMNSPETKRWMDEGESLQRATAEEVCKRIDWTKPIALLGKNFLGAEAWQAHGIDVGEEPPLPATITESLLESDCPLHPGEKIKDTHLLVLIPKTVDEEPYTALKLDELCATRKGSGDKLIYGEVKSWRDEDWANGPQPQSEWVLISKSDPDPSKVPAEKHFRSKNIAAQQEVHDDHYQEYREVRTVELMTAVLLNDLVNGEPRMLHGLNYLRCVEPSAPGRRVLVGSFGADGLGVVAGYGGNGRDNIGRALARKS